MLRLLRRAIDAAQIVLLASVVACAVVPLAVAFRGSLWWLLGTSDRDAGLAQLALLMLLAALVTSAGTLAAAALLRAGR